MLADGAANENAEEEEGEAEKKRSLFEGLVFFLSRETPRESLAFVIKSLGGSVGWEGEGSAYKAEDSAITHHIIDRPTVKAVVSGREYVQPQWIYDSVNFGVLLPVDLYAVGKALPPHLSPFVDDEEEGYKPDFAKFVDTIKSGEEQSIPALKAAENLTKEEVEAKERAADEARYRSELEAEVAGEAVPETSKEARAKGKGAKRSTRASAKAGASSQKDDEDEEDEDQMTGMVMTRKDRKLYEAIQKSKTTKRERAAKLTEKRKRIKTRGSK